MSVVLIGENVETKWDNRPIQNGVVIIYYKRGDCMLSGSGQWLLVVLRRLTGKGKAFIKVLFKFDDLLMYKLCSIHYLYIRVFCSIFSRGQAAILD